MEFEDQEEQEEEMAVHPTSYDSLHGNSSARLKMENSDGGRNININNNIINNNNSININVNNGNKPRYRECLKNHAVGIGGHALDGCGEFLPGGPDGTLDALKCAACNCHRNFHRKETDPSFSSSIIPTHHHHNSHPHHPLLPQFATYYRSPSGYLHVSGGRPAPLALPSTSGGHSRDFMEEEDMSNPNYTGGSSRKRFRTKFTQEQKDKMLGLAERLGWRIQKHDEEAVQHFCNESGVKRHVLKVWMHNNKHTLGKKL